jgi:hypothetical protein
MRTKLTLILVFAVVCTVAMTSCKKNDVENWKTLKNLYKEYEYGMIRECKLDGATVYSASRSCQDCSTYLYDANGEYIADISYYSDFDNTRLTDCEIIYCSEDNIWGYDAVDKYGLGN